ncbi:DUF4398 domain-containing protein [Chiayiivirga flava]|uniref:DUF4398 domain-containing protein n=1 Tax=Chiayiivirga flava TaxID=659595 RepID=A0A7W8FZZ1_9GAMM|nr:DUF4398 domain-containing protein [Chiayiivirga flava]MBB5207714.1 hypothetical protein [Chiayiivirga flava]
MKRQTLTLLLLSLPALAVAGRQEADLSLTQARSAVAAAERAGSVQAAPVPTADARALLARAEGSYEDRDWTDAEREAHRARADARLAEARARQVKAESATAEIEAAVETLRAELNRQGGVR